MMIRVISIGLMFLALLGVQNGATRQIRSYGSCRMRISTSSIRLGAQR